MSTEYDMNSESGSLAFHNVSAVRLLSGLALHDSLFSVLAGVGLSGLVVLSMSPGAATGSELLISGSAPLCPGLVLL